MYLSVNYNCDTTKLHLNNFLIFKSKLLVRNLALHTYSLKLALYYSGIRYNQISCDKYSRKKNMYIKK
jgi:hypothetical protein